MKGKCSSHFMEVLLRIAPKVQSACLCLLLSMLAVYREERREDMSNGQYLVPLCTSLCKLSTPDSH